MKNKQAEWAGKGKGCIVRSGFVEPPAKRRLALAIQMLFAVGAGEAWAYTCVLDGATVGSAQTNAVVCDNRGTLTVDVGGTLTNATTGVLNNRGTIINGGLLTNDGLVDNRGAIITSGRLNGSGTLNNAGTLLVRPGGSATIASSANLSKGTLTGGAWIVDSGAGFDSKSKASLAVGSGAISTNNAHIELIGAGARFDQIGNLANNGGALTVSGGAGFTSAALHNTGTLTVAAGGVVNIASSGNLANGTLTGGTWVVDNTWGTSKLTVGSGAITTNNAHVTLIGSGALASFSQLAGLANNVGTLTVGAGASLGSKASLYNTGTLAVRSGGEVSLMASKNLAGGTLTGGTWIVDGRTDVATLTIGRNAITTNNANIELIGAGASFAQLSALAENQGSLTIGQGATYTSSVPLTNTGTLVTLAGGTLDNRPPNGKFAPITNNGLIVNNGALIAGSDIGGSGALSNSGTLTVLSRATVQIASSSNFSNGTLTGGTWVVDSTGGSTAALSVGSGNITTNNANIMLIGSQSRFDQLAGLVDNKGSLTISGGGMFASAYLSNTGVLKVADRSTVSIADSGNLSKGTLTGGTWIVDSGAGFGGKSYASLAVGSGAISTNNAHIELIGAGARFDQIGNLANNGGALTVSGGAGFTSAALHNTGTLTVAAGGVVNIVSSGNLANGTLTGGTWVVDNTGGTSKLTVGSGAITTNNAHVTLVGSGALASFSQLAGLANNVGTLTVGAGASLGSKASLYNTGTLAVRSGGEVSLMASKNLAGGTLTGGTWIVDGRTDVAALTIGRNAITTNNANIELIGAGASFAQLSTLATNQGSLTLGAGATLRTSVALNNTGTIVNAAGATLDVYDNKQKVALANQGSISNAGMIATSGTFSNAGDLLLESTGVISVDRFVQTAGVTTLKDGALLLAGNVEFLGGRLTGSGLVDPPTTIVIGADAVVAPDKVLTLQGETTFNGELDIHIAGANDYGLLHVLGALNFGSGARIDVDFDPAFRLTDLSYVFRFLVASNGIFGLENVAVDFSGLDSRYASRLNWDCQATGCDYSLVMTRFDDPGQVPEPGTWLLVALGLFGLAANRRHRIANER